MAAILINPEQVRTYAQQIKSCAGRIKDALDNTSSEIAKTQSIYEEQAASDLRDKFAALKPELDKFDAYLRKVATYLEQNVAAAAEAVQQANVQNVASIQKPQ